MNNVIPMTFAPDDFDFRAYMEDSEPQAKVLGAETWRDALVRSTSHDDVLTGARLPWSKTHDHLRFRGGEVTLWQGINGHGKSQMLGQACIGFAAQNEGVCIASFEMKPIRTLQRMLRQVAMNDHPTEDAANRMIDWATNRVWLYDQQGTVKPEMVYAVIRYSAQKLGVKHFVVDSLMKCVRGEDDYNGQKDFVDMLTSLARDHDMHIHIVHHVRKGESEDKAPGKMDSKGSGAIVDQVDQVLTVWRNKRKEREIESLQRAGGAADANLEKAPDAVLICDKNRHGEWEGRVSLWYHPQSLQYTGDKRCMPIDMIGGW